MKAMDEYQDIIDKQRYISTNKARMSTADRAAQFSAFAALTGFDGVIRETGRLTDQATELDESEKLVINETLCRILEELDTQPAVTVTWFCPDERKSGGSYVRFTGRLKKADMYHRLLIFTDNTCIPVDQLIHIERNI